MNVHISSKGRTVSKRVRNFVTERVEKATRRFTNRISRVDVSVANSDDAVDQECRVVLSVNGQGTIVATAQAENLMAAIAEAVDRAKRGLTSAVDRRRSGRRFSPPIL
jgi:ribosomal subunit interface protein